MSASVFRWRRTVLGEEYPTRHEKYQQRHGSENIFYLFIYTITIKKVLLFTY